MKLPKTPVARHSFAIKLTNMKESKALEILRSLYPMSEYKSLGSIIGWLIMERFHSEMDYYKVQSSLALIEAKHLAEITKDLADSFRKEFGDYCSWESNFFTKRLESNFLTKRRNETTVSFLYRVRNLKAAQSLYRSAYRNENIETKYREERIFNQTLILNSLSHLN